MHRLPFRNSVHLTQAEAHDLMVDLLSGDLATDAIAEILRFLRRKGETVAELVGFATALRELSPFADFQQDNTPVLDTCGTGGDNAKTFNISTATAFVVAGAGVTVAKHGNRRISSECGSADVLEALGIPITISQEHVRECLNDAGIGFFYAPLLHPGIKHAQEARLLVPGRTVFNMLGPLTNPVRARFQLIGAFSVKAAEMIALAAARLNVQKAFVVHGSDGLDEITITGPTTVFQVEDGRVQKGQWTPADFGMEGGDREALLGSDAESNAATIRSILDGVPGPPRDIVVANAAAALLLADRASDLPAAVALAAEAIDSGAAKSKLERLTEVTASLRV